MMDQRADKVQLKNEMNQTNSNQNSLIQMFLDIVDIQSLQQQSIVAENNQYKIEFSTKNTFMCKQAESSLIRSNQDDISKDKHKSKTSYHLKNSNVMKNILKSFQRCIENEQDEQQKQNFCHLSNVTYGHAQLCKFLKLSLKTEGKRWNMKAKNLVEKSKLKSLFEYYLTNINKLWLDNSKVSNKQEHEDLVIYLLNQIQNPSDTCRIRFYQKSKQIIKSCV
ncbi:hypothetical protein TTHERM_00400740 (macronuclear) [Tetrahymena thermophila SB210]|uniref:Uncharacterized protein n=1 Tax=Tetrahymena thermophila (strain SB210) TaxID=312017 RepID=I7M7I7_TETTS|nr:hypothetical protein TTHERM_00400740 [Tetrahymena thermophila SB210]EAR93802.1 hypothetical protein TTHERM_00400740 [Tetrahymena thermophila SB210]|eukprot:XP_001014047.1 hypothetical protein TTHERM_00400740 [Tetrahymena thermophila SB210]